MKNKLLIITNDFNSGGIAKYVRKIIPFLSKGYEIFLVTRDEISKKDIKKFLISKSYRVKTPRIVHFWPLKEIYFFISGILFFNKVRFNIIFCNYPFFIPSKVKKECKIIQVFHSLHRQFFTAKTPFDIYLYALKLMHLFMIPLDNWRMNYSDKTIFTSKVMYDLAELSNRVFIPNPIDKKILWKNKGESEKIKISFVARNDPFKGIDFLEDVLDHCFIKNYDKFKNLEFYIVGINRLRKKYPNTKIFGNLSFDETENVFNKTNIFISTSYIENSPNVLLEALSYGNVPLVSRVGDCQRVLKDKKFLFIANNFGDFMKKFTYLINNLSKQNKIYPDIEQINRRYDVQKNIHKILDLLNTP